MLTFLKLIIISKPVKKHGKRSRKLRKEKPKLHIADYSPPSSIKIEVC